MTTQIPLAKIGIVIPVRNCLDYTQAALETIRTRHPYQLYVIDDYSDEPMKSWLASRPDIITFTDPPGSTGLAWNWNLGISAALADGCTQVLVINNDILLHPQAIDRMAARLGRGDLVLVTGDDIAPRCNAPKDVFTWDPAEEREDHHLDFSCFMLGEQAIRRVGWFDEGFLGAYFEDNDYYARLVRADEQALRLYCAPYFHHSMRTVNNNPKTQPLIQQRAGRNAEYFRTKWGRMPAGTREDMLSEYSAFPFGREADQDRDTQARRLEQLFWTAVDTPSDINDHLEMLYRLASSVHDVAEIGVGMAQSTCALAYTHPRKLRVYEVPRTAANVRVEYAARLSGIDFERIPAEGEVVRPESTDLLFIDGLHDEERVALELDIHAPFVRRFLVLHDTESYGERGETPGHRGIWPAVSAYMRQHPEWTLQSHLPNNNGLTVFVRDGA
ncbi:glycosyltransferase [Capsulimonas corticalis]|nr:glycosyltransferase [Capsulimonas corticalis]